MIYRCIPHSYGLAIEPLAFSQSINYCSKLSNWILLKHTNVITQRNVCLQWSTKMKIKMKNVHGLIPMYIFKSKISSILFVLNIIVKYYSNMNIIVKIILYWTYCESYLIPTARRQRFRVRACAFCRLFFAYYHIAKRIKV